MEQSSDTSISIAHINSEESVSVTQGTNENSSSMVSEQAPTSIAHTNSEESVSVAQGTSEKSSSMVSKQLSKTPTSTAHTNSEESVSPAQGTSIIGKNTTLSGIGSAANKEDSARTIVGKETVNESNENTSGVSNENLREQSDDSGNKEQLCPESDNLLESGVSHKPSSQAGNVVRPEETEIAQQCTGEHLQVTSSSEGPSLQTRGRKRHFSDNVGRNENSLNKETAKNEKRMRHCSSTSSCTAQPLGGQLLAESPTCSVHSAGGDLQGVVLSISENAPTANLLQSLSESVQPSGNNSAASTFPAATRTISTKVSSANTNTSSLTLSTERVAQIRSNWQSNASRAARTSQDTSSQDATVERIQPVTVPTSTVPMQHAASILPVLPPTPSISSAGTMTSGQNSITSASNVILQNYSSPTCTSVLQSASPVSTSVTANTGNESMMRSTRQLGTVHTQEFNSTANIDNQPLPSQTVWGNLSDAQKRKVVDARKKCFAWWRQYAHLMREEDSNEALGHILNYRLSSFRDIYSRYSRLIAQCITNYQSGQPSNQVPHPRQSSNCTGTVHSQWLAAEQQVQRPSPVPQSSMLPSGNSQVRLQQHAPAGPQVSGMNSMQQQILNGNPVQVGQQQPSVHQNPQVSQPTHYALQNQRSQQQQQSFPAQPQQHQQWPRISQQPLDHQQQQQVLYQQASTFTSANQPAQSCMYAQQHISRPQQTHQSNHAEIPPRPILFNEMENTGTRMRNSALQAIQNMCQNQQNRTNMPAPPRYGANIQPRQGCNVARHSSRMHLNYHTQSGVSAGNTAHRQSGYPAGRESGSTFPGYTNSRQPTPTSRIQQVQSRPELSRLLVNSNPQLSRLLVTTENSSSNSWQNRQHQGNSSQIVSQYGQYPPNVTAPMNRHSSAVKSSQSSIPHSAIGNSSQIRRVGPTSGRVSVPASSTNVSSILPVRLLVSQASPQGREVVITATTHLNTTLSVHMNASTSVNISTLSSQTVTMAAGIENISPPARVSSIVGCPTDVQPIVIAPVEDMPPRPAPVTSSRGPFSPVRSETTTALSSTNENTTSVSSASVVVRQKLQGTVSTLRYIVNKCVS